jgi:hypothetical protein
MDPRPLFPQSQIRSPAAARPAPQQPVVGNVVRLWGPCPWAEDVSDYDRKNFSIFAWVIEGDDAGISERDMARIIFRICPDKHPYRALTVVRSHLARARWLQANHYPGMTW